MVDNGVKLKDIITDESIKQVAEELSNKRKETPMINTMLNALGGPDFMNELGVILELPDNQFDIISEMMLEETAYSLSEPNSRLALQTAMVEADLSVEDFTTIQSQLFEEIDEQFIEYSQTRRDFLKRLLGSTFNIMEEIYYEHRVIRIPIELAHPDAKLPRYAHDTDAAMDLYALDDYTVGPGETVLVKTGIKTAIPRGYALLIQPRSGQSLKTKLRVANTPGLIDAGYRDEIGIIIENIEPRIADVGFDMVNGKPVVNSIKYGKSYVIEKGQRIAQMRLVAAPHVAWTNVENINDFESDRNGGFGSSGTK